MAPRAFGCTYFVQDLSPRTIKCVFVGYSELRKDNGAIVLQNIKYFVSADITFF